MNRLYILEGHTVIPAPSEEAWEILLDDLQKRRVAYTEITPEIEVSTVFLGTDSTFGRGPQPLVFETLVSGGEFHGQIMRYATWDEAEAGHNATCAAVMGTLQPGRTISLRASPHATTSTSDIQESTHGKA